MGTIMILCMAIGMIWGGHRLMHHPGDRDRRAEPAAITDDTTTGADDASAHAP